MLELKPGMLIKIKRDRGEISPTSQPDDDSHEQIAYVRELETFEGSDEISVICSEIGPDIEFSYGSPLHERYIEKYIFPSIKERYIGNRARLVGDNRLSYHDLEKMKNHWLNEAIKADELAHKRRPLWMKIYEIFGFVIYMSWRLITRQKGPMG